MVDGLKSGKFDNSTCCAPSRASTLRPRFRGSPRSLYAAGSRGSVSHHAKAKTGCNTRRPMQSPFLPLRPLPTLPLTGTFAVSIPLRRGPAHPSPSLVLQKANLSLGIADCTKPRRAPSLSLSVLMRSSAARRAASLKYRQISPKDIGIRRSDCLSIFFSEEVCVCFSRRIFFQSIRISSKDHPSPNPSALSFLSSGMMNQDI